MNLIELSSELINDVQGLRRDFRSGKISLETYTHELDGICQIEKLANVMIKTRITEERFRKPIMTDARALPDPENEPIRCPGKGADIERHECLDLSGETPPHYDDCGGCEHFKTTRKLLLPEG